MFRFGARKSCAPIFVHLSYRIVRDGRQKGATAVLCVRNECQPSANQRALTPFNPAFARSRFETPEVYALGVRPGSLQTHRTRRKVQSSRSRHSTVAPLTGGRIYLLRFKPHRTARVSLRARTREYEFKTTICGRYHGSVPRRLRGVPMSKTIHSGKALAAALCMTVAGGVNAAEPKQGRNADVHLPHHRRPL